MYLILIISYKIIIICVNIFNKKTQKIKTKQISLNLVPQFAATSNFDIKAFTDVPLNHIQSNTNQNFYANKTSSNFQNNLNLMEKLDQIPEGLRVSKSISNTSMRKSFNAEEYMFNLKLKLSSGEMAAKADFDSNSNFAQFIAKEKEYLKSQSKLNSNKNEYDSINNLQQLKSISNPNISMNIYETISANFNKENLTGFTNSQNNFFQNSTGNLNSNINNNNNNNNFNFNQNKNNCINNEINANSKNDNLKVISENKDEFKSFAKEQNEFDKLMQKTEEKSNAFGNIDITANTVSQKSGMFTSSQINSGNNNNLFNNNNVNVISNLSKNIVNPAGNANHNKKSKILFILKTLIFIFLLFFFCVILV